MARRQTDGACAEAGLQAARTLLLVPEAPLIALLLVLYLALGQPPLLGVAVALLIISFIARCLALIGARASHAAARYREAEVLSQIALALNPWSADALALRGSIVLGLGRPAEAEPLLRRALGLLPGRADFYTARSVALLALSRPAEAADAARRALALEPGYAPAQLHLAEAELATGAPAEAVEDRLRDGLAGALETEIDRDLGKMKPADLADDDAIEAMASRAVARLCNDKVGKKPVVQVMISRLDA